MHEALAVICLAAVLAAAVVRPRGLSEAAVAVPAALLLLIAGSIGWASARDEITRIGPVVGFLAAVLALADGCAGEGLFEAVGTVLARRAHARPQRLLVGTFVAAAVTTAVLSLDTTVVLLTPVVVATAARARVSTRPHTYAVGHLANTASLLLPVSNLTNLLALAVVPISFSRFAALMTLPWLSAIAVELVLFRWWFRADLRRVLPGSDLAEVEVPRFAVVVLVLTLVGFVVSSYVDIAPVWAATAGAVALASKRLASREVGVVHVVRSTAPAFCIFVLALAVVVRAAGDHGLGSLVRHLLPHGASLAALIGIAAVAAIAANVLNNLPATLLLLPVVAPRGVGPVLAVLVGVDIGPNLTYVGSLATLLWRRLLAHDVEGRPRLGEFSALAAVTVAPTLLVATVLLWVSIRFIGV